MNRVKLGNVARIITGPFGSQLHQSDYVVEGIPCIMPQDIRERSIDLENVARVSESDASRLRRYATRKDDIVYARRGDIEKHAFITCKTAGSLCGTGCLLVRIDSKKACPEYVSFYLNRPQSRSWLRQNAVGSNMPNLNVDILSALPLALPDLKSQKSIACLLTAIDDKISLNKRLCAELEETARLVYDYWFTQFDFPNEDGKPYRSSGGKMTYSDVLKSEVPEGWVAVRVGDLVTVVKGISYKSDDLVGEGVPMVSLASFNADGSYKPEAIKSYSGKVDDKRSARYGDLIMCVTQQTAIDLTGKTNVIGKALLVPDIFSGDIVISTDVAKLVPWEPLHSYVLEMLFKRMDIHKHVVGYANGTKIKHLDVEGALDFYISMPATNQGVLSTFAQMRQKQIAQCSELLKECDELIKLRDQLLPMLMNGQVKIGSPSETDESKE